MTKLDFEARSPVLAYILIYIIIKKTRHPARATFFLFRLLLLEARELQNGRQNSQKLTETIAYQCNDWNFTFRKLEKTIGSRRLTLEARIVNEVGAKTT